jgi:hypothetical protein
MNIERIPEYLIRWGVTLLGIFLSLYLVQQAGNGDYGKIAIVFIGITFIILTLTVRRNIWMIIPMCWPLYGRIEVLPLPFTVKELAVAIAFVVSIILIMLRVIRQKPEYGLVDWILWLSYLWLAFAFIRNPVGVAAVDSDRVAGRPYFVAAIGFAAYFTLGRASTSAKWLQRLPWLCVGVLFAFFTVNVAIYFNPALGATWAPFYTGFDFSRVDAMRPLYALGAEETDMVRYEFFRDIGRFGSIALCAYFAPPTLVSPWYLGRFCAFALVMAGLLLSGFRSFIVYAGGMFFLGSYFRCGMGSAVKSALLGLGVALLLLLGHGTIYKLPFSAQRALAFIPEWLSPGKLDRDAIDAGVASTEWRTEMWILALTTDRYITDKIKGDGFGITKQQLAEMVRIQTIVGGSQEGQENMAIVGDFHNGPIATIRVVGIIGLTFSYILLFMLARRAFRLIIACRGTPLYSAAMFFGMPIVFEPFWFTFVFGSYSEGPGAFAISLGLVKMLENSLAQWRISVSQAETEVPATETPVAPVPHLALPRNA